MTGRVLLDLRAGAPWTERATEVFRRASEAGWADPSHPSSEGRRARTWLDAARATVAELSGFRHVVFLPDREHALDALAANGIATATTARRSVLARAAVIAPVDDDGRVDWAAVTIPPDALVVRQAGNEETGVIDAPGPSRRTLLDASLVLGRAPIAGDADLVLADARAWGSPIDVAVLLSDRPLAIPDAVQAPAAVVAADALSECWPLMAIRSAQEREAMDRFEVTLGALLPDVQFHGIDRVGHMRSLSVLHLDGETLMRALDAQGWVVGSGSACVQDGTPSHVLAAMHRITHGNLRLALPVDTDLDLLDAFARVVADTAASLRREAGVEDL